MNGRVAEGVREKRNDRNEKIWSRTELAEIGRARS